MTTTQNKPVTKMQAGDLVHYYGGVFKVLEDAKPAYGFVAYGEQGVTDCATAQAVCLSGEVEGYFKPGKEWGFQGNHLSSFCVEKTQ